MDNRNKRRRRILIISGDESVIDELQRNDKMSLCKSVILESCDDEAEPRIVKEKKTALTCVICQSPANGFNFDVISCESCKSFFRRNALKDPPLRCPSNNVCDLTWDCRRRCSACRLKKCFQVGMKAERILMAQHKAQKRREKKSNSFTTLVDQELFLFSECLQENSLSNSSRNLLTKEDLQRLESIQQLYQRRIELAQDGLPWNPSMYAMTFLQKINSHSVPLIRLLTFFKQIPEFNQLNADDKVTLIKFNLLPLLCINCTLSYNAENDSMAETDSDAPWDPSVLQSVYGVDGYQCIRRIFDKFLDIAKSDQKIIQLALITFILTKGFSAVAEKEPILNNSLAVYRAQNYYTELLWKYLETMHGAQQAIQIYSQLIGHFISWQIFQIYIRNHIEQSLLSTDTNELVPFMKALLNFGTDD